MKTRRELLKALPFLAAIPFVRIPKDDSVIRNWRAYAKHQTVTINSDRFPVPNPWFSFPSEVRELHSTPTGIFVQCDNGIYLICGGPEPEQMYVLLVAKARYEDVKLQWHNESPIGVEKRAAIDVEEILRRVGWKNTKNIIA